METAWDLMHKVQSGGWAYPHVLVAFQNATMVQQLIRYLVLGLIHKIGA